MTYVAIRLDQTIEGQDGSVRRLTGDEIRQLYQPKMEYSLLSDDPRRRASDIRYSWRRELGEFILMAEVE